MDPIKYMPVSAGFSEELMLNAWACPLCGARDPEPSLHSDWHAGLEARLLPAPTPPAEPEPTPDPDPAPMPDPEPDPNTGEVDAPIDTTATDDTTAPRIPTEQ